MPTEGLVEAAPVNPGQNVASVLHNNRRRARAIAALPGVVVFGVVALVLTAAGDAVVGVIAGTAAGAVVSFALLFGATSVLLRALGARRVAEDDLPRAFNLVDGLCASMGLPIPAVCLVDDDARDALALGRGHRTAVVVLTSGLLEALDPVALEAVLAHELMHVRRCDIAPASVSAALFFPVSAFFSGAGSAVHRLAGRGREFHTDQLAVGVTRYPPGLREALTEITSGPAPRPPSSISHRAAKQATRWLWTVAMPLDTGSWATPAEELVGGLDVAPVRISALDEW